jgi:hypothetical protein
MAMIALLHGILHPPTTRFAVSHRRYTALIHKGYGMSHLHKRLFLFGSMVVAWTLCNVSARVDEDKIRRVVPVFNAVPKGASPIKGDVVRVEVIDAVDLKNSSWELKVAVRVRSTRKDRVRGSLKLEFDGKQMDQPRKIDLPDGQSDLLIFGIYAGEGKGSGQLSKLSAELRDIRITDK